MTTHFDFDFFVKRQQPLSDTRADRRGVRDRGPSRIRSSELAHRNIVSSAAIVSEDVCARHSYSIQSYRGEKW
jgi:hypothetical protein